MIILKKKKFNKNLDLLNDIKKYRNHGNHHYIIYEVLKSYNELFLSKEKNLNLNFNLGKLSLINEAFQLCYLNQPEANLKFFNLINSDENDYSRYLFFYFSKLAQDEEFKNLTKISKKINIIESNLLIQQSKHWIDNLNFEKFNDFFSCENESDIIAEFFFLISNFLASENNFEESNFYSNISHYLNPKFYFNLTHLLDNYFENDNFEKVKKILRIINKEDEIYYWFKIKKLAQIIYFEKDSKEYLKFIEKKFNEYSYPSPKIIYDMANIYKSEEKYEKSINYYSQVLKKLDIDSDAYAEVLYRRGSSYERLGDDEKSDKDLIKSLSIKPDDAYVLNYLGYSWLERNYKIYDAIDMLNKAYDKNSNSPYITDSVGWGYYLIDDFVNAEKFINKAIKLLPKDPIINDHYGDILWKLNREIQARYFWQSALNSEEADDKLKNKIKSKLLKGLN